MNTLEQSTTNVTAPSTTPAIGNTVSFHFNCDLHGDDVFTGTIIDAKESKVFKSMMYRVQPQADDRLAILDPVWVKPAQIEGVVSDDPVYDQMPALKAIDAAYQSWEIAYLAGRFEEAGRLSAIHDQLFDAHMARLFPKFRKSTNAPTSSDSGPAIASASSQVTSIDNAPETQQTPLSPVLGASDVHPLALRQPGSYAYDIDWDARAQARRQQHAAAKARVEAKSGVYQRASNETPKMHDADYISQICKNA